MEAFQRTGFTGGINWYRNISRNWRLAEGKEQRVNAPSLMIMAEKDAVLPPSAAAGMERFIPDLEKALVEDSGHWTQQEQPQAVNRILIDFFAKCGLKLVDFKLEFGRLAEDPGKIVLADEISPDGCRLWDLKTNEKLDKDRFRQDLGGVEEAYQEVARRLGLLQPDEESAVLDLDSHRKKRGK